MKLTKRDLEMLIKEVIVEKNSILLEMPEEDLSDTQETLRSPSQMIKQQLFHIAGKANQLSELIQDEEELEENTLSQILKASKLITVVFDDLLYKKSKDNIQE